MSSVDGLVLVAFLLFFLFLSCSFGNNTRVTFGLYSGSLISTIPIFLLLFGLLIIDLGLTGRFFFRHTRIGHRLQVATFSGGLFTLFFPFPVTLMREWPEFAKDITASYAFIFA